MLQITEHIPPLDAMENYPKRLFYKGHLSLLQKKMVSIVGTRRPSQYTKHFTQLLAHRLSKAGVVVVSGAAMGVDAIAHRGAGLANSIAVVATGLDIRYPKINRDLIASLEQEGLVLSQFEAGFKATPWSFVVRNELVVALGEVLIVTQADLNSGSMRSVEFALKMGRPIYVLPHRIGESEGSNRLLQEGLATPIYDIDAFVSKCVPSGAKQEGARDPFVDYCSSNPHYDDALKLFGTQLYEAELEGRIEVKNGKIFLI